jgi:hypothetical protein
MLNAFDWTRRAYDKSQQRSIGVAMNIVRVALMIPAFAGSVLLAKEAPPKSAPAAKASYSVIYRRMRIDRVLTTLDQVAAVTQQMSPEHSNRIEPVLVDLAEQTLGLVDEETIGAKETDQQLDRIEETLTGLMRSVNRMVEPEVML